MDRLARATDWGRRPGVGTVALLLAALAMGACSDRDRLDGSWYSNDFRMMKPCTDELEFDAGQIVTTLTCRLSEGAYGQQIIVGQYVQQDNQVQVFPLSSSCPRQSKQTMTWLVDISRNQMDRTVGIETTRYLRGKANIAGIRVTGCFDAELKNFDEGPIVALP
jgi:hypothetical protein